jgi:hypothetical protein
MVGKPPLILAGLIYRSCRLVAANRISVLLALLRIS